MDMPGTELLANQLREMPEIVEVVEIIRNSPFNLVPEGFVPSIQVSSWDGKLIDAEDITIWEYQIIPEIIDFYEFQLIAGEMLTDTDPVSIVLLNESAVRLFGWYNPVGRRFNNFTVKGVIRNVHNNAPTIPVRPIFYSRYIPASTSPSVDSEFIFHIVQQRSIMFRYHEGMWEPTRDRVRQLVENEYPHISRHLELFNTEEEVNKFLKSENALIRLLLFVSIICILICIFGFVSLVSLTCEERRKEIAIRKVHGATAGEILAMFAKEYFLLLFIGAAIAFTVGYHIMQRWLEHYVIRTSIPAWIYLSIVFVMALIIVLCVGWRVWKTSRENPADVLKSE
jgi:ABC-type antimicrobial peptide transport system permease subunit